MSRLQWGHGDEAVEEPTSMRELVCWLQDFNGATAMKPWKRYGSKQKRSPDGQLQWGHGDEAVEERGQGHRPQRRQCDFNGATAMKPWKRHRGYSADHRGDHHFNGATAMKPWKRFRAVR